MRHTLSRPTLALAPALLLATLLCTAGEVLAAKGNCNTPKTAFRTETDGVTTTATTWVTVPKSVVSFTQGGNNPSCVVVRFSVLPRANYLVYIRPLIDGTILATPDNVQLEYKSPGYLSTRAFEFVFPKIAPGNHVLRMQWITPDGQQTWFYRRTITVQHR
jgi:hypothetical protein